MNRLILALSCLLLLAGCAIFRGVGSTAGALAHGDLSGAARAGAATGRAVGAKAAEYAEKQKRCAEFEKREVPYEEEVAIGGAVALGLAQKSGGVFVEISPELASLKELDAKAWARRKPKPGPGAKTDLNRYVNALGKSLAAFSSRPDIDWTFVVLQANEANAFSAPGGYVFVTTGLIKQTQNEAQLAGVLAHEIGHVTGRHSLRSYRAAKSKLCTAAFVAGDVASEAAKGAGASSVWSSMLEATKFDLDGSDGPLVRELTDLMLDLQARLGNGAEAENAADRASFELMVFAGYDYREFLKLLATMPDGGLFMPHPSNKSRADYVAKLRTEQYGEFPFDDLKTPETAKEVSVVNAK